MHTKYNIVLRFLCVDEKLETQIIRIGYRLRGFEKKMLRRLSGPMRVEVTDEWRKLRNQEPHRPTSLRNFVGFLSTSRQIPGCTPGWTTTTSFQVLYDSVCTDYLTIRHCRARATDGAVNEKINNNSNNNNSVCLYHEECSTTYQSKNTAS
jgi:hypothetical protein